MSKEKKKEPDHSPMNSPVGGWVCLEIKSMNFHAERAAHAVGGWGGALREQSKGDARYGNVT